VKSYLEGCGVPTTRLGETEVPRLMMGNHPFEGWSYVSRERDAWYRDYFCRVARIAEVLRFAVQQAGLTVTQVDHVLPERNRMHLQAIWEAGQDTGVEIGLLAYILTPVMFEGEMIVRSARTRATFYAHDERVGGEAFRTHIVHDPLVRRLLDERPEAFITSQTTPPYTPEEAARFTIDYRQLERHLGFYEGCNIVIADPGSEIELLAMTGRFDLIREYLGFLRRRFPCIVTSSHHAGVTLPLLEAEGIDVDGYLTPVNRLGAHMNPTPELALEAIRQASKPVIAIKPMGGGRDLGREAFEYVFAQDNVVGSLFGMGTIEQVRETSQAAREALGVA